MASSAWKSGVKGSLAYWATPSGSEVDFVWWRGADVAAIEVKNAREFRGEQKKGLDAFRETVKVRAFLVYRGKREMNVDGVRVLPVETFLRRLHAGEIIG